MDTFVAAGTGTSFLVLFGRAWSGKTSRAVRIATRATVNVLLLVFILQCVTYCDS
jgi:hypothetical protein